MENTGILYVLYVHRLTYNRFIYIAYITYSRAHIPTVVLTLLLSHVSCCNYGPRRIKLVTFRRLLHCLRIQFPSAEIKVFAIVAEMYV